MANRYPHTPDDREDTQRTRTSLIEALEVAAHCLPSQFPLHAFVHHNTLHAFEALRFEDAVEQAAQKYGAEPYPSEAYFRQRQHEGQISGEVLRSILEEEGVEEQPLYEGGPTKREVFERRLHHLFEVPSAATIEWLRSEKRLEYDLFPDAYPTSNVCGSAFAQTLWDTFTQAQQRQPELKRTKTNIFIQYRQKQTLIGEINTDDWVNPLLIRASAAFLDQGIAYWGMPGREKGFFDAFIALYTRRIGPPDPWVRTASADLAQQARRGWDAADSARDALHHLGVAIDDWAEYLEQALLALPGWAGMFRQLEARPDRAPVRGTSAKLIDFVAIRLVLDRHAIAYAQTIARREEVSDTDDSWISQRQEIFDAVMTARHLGLTASHLTPDVSDKLFSWTCELNETRRRRYLFLAFERTYHNHVLDTLTAHSRAPLDVHPNSTIQAVFCIDDREESFRRHLEEIMPQVETLGFTGFFGIPMAFQAHDDFKARPLCPANISPRHIVQEHLARSAVAPSKKVRRRRGQIEHMFRIGSHTAIRGTIFSALAGSFATLPLVMRCLFPRATEKFRHRFGHPPDAPPKTQIDFCCSPNDATTRPQLQLGFTHDEMCNIVASTLRTMGIEKRLCDLVIMVGHGSSSLNNPHEAAYDCGACGGGRGGPNARVFTAMANLPSVREQLIQDFGIEIESRVHFVGAYHNTADDSVTYYDTEHIPCSHRQRFEHFCDAIERTKRINAHERCRRFEDVSLRATPEQAFEAGQTHAFDLAQPRPEYGHSTNAICIFGRRASTRGLFLDRRAFLVSYDANEDPEGELLKPLLETVGPIGAGINLEYYFSAVDNQYYGAGTKLPHNIVGMLGVMDGNESDLRTGLSWQMVEIHEPMRLLVIIEAESTTVLKLLNRSPIVANLLQNGWIRVAIWSSTSHQLYEATPRGLVPYQASAIELPRVRRSQEHYRGHRGRLRCAQVESSMNREASLS